MVKPGKQEVTVEAELVAAGVKAGASATHDFFKQVALALEKLLKTQQDKALDLVKTAVLVSAAKGDKLPKWSEQNVQKAANNIVENIDTLNKMNYQERVKNTKQLLSDAGIKMEKPEAKDTTPRIKGPGR